MKFSVKNFIIKCEQIRKLKTADMFTYTKKIYNGKLHVLCSDTEKR